MRVIIDVKNCYNCPFSHNEFRDGLYCIPLRTTLVTVLDLKNEIVAECPLTQYQQVKSSLVNEAISIINETPNKFFTMVEEKDKIISRLRKLLHFDLCLP